MGARGRASPRTCLVWLPLMRRSPPPCPSRCPTLAGQSLEPTIIDHRVRLLVLDSAASLARADFAPGSLPDRQRMLGQQVGSRRGVRLCMLSTRCRVGAAGFNGGMQAALVLARGRSQLHKPGPGQSMDLTKACHTTNIDLP